MPSKLLVQEYLLNHSIEDLKKEHGINSSCHIGDYKFSLNYDQFESKPSALTNECRGLILSTYHFLPVHGLNDIIGSTIVLARPMARFFNYGDSNAASLDFNKALFVEKLDGTCCILYFDLATDKWCVGTRSIPEANLSINGFESHTFRTLFEMAVNETYGIDIDQFTQQLNIYHTYCFELTSPYNRIVVDYKSCNATLLSVRNNYSGVEIDPTTIKLSNTINQIRVPKVFSFAKISDLIDFVNSQNPLEFEGIVARDDNFNRIKIKNAAYVSYNRIHDMASKNPRALLEIILLEKDDDVAPMLSDFLRDKLHEYKTNLVTLINKVDQQYESIYSADRKTFAINIQKNQYWMAPMMSRWQGQCTGLHSWLLSKKLDSGMYPDSLLNQLLQKMNEQNV